MCIDISKVGNCEASNPIYSFILPYRLLRMRGFIIISIPYRLLRLSDIITICLFGIMELMR